MSRTELQHKLFPSGIPKLWCPTLSYFAAAGQFDRDRIGQHLQRISPWVRGILVPGSTGEGWEMSDDAILELLEVILPQASRLNMHVLIGILKTDTAQVLKAIQAVQKHLHHPAVVGITVCAAKGAELSQVAIHEGLAEVLALGIPTALYQLPQVTLNEMSTETVANLAAEFPNFIMFKDTSGEDRVAGSIGDSQGVFMVRGSEKQGYAQWLRSAGGNYDGFLLSTANCFARQLSSTIDHCDAGRVTQATELSGEISQIVSSAFEIFGQLSIGNVFTSANKALDHLLVHGSAFREHPTPMLISGTRLPIELIEALAHRWPQLISGSYNS